MKLYELTEQYKNALVTLDDIDLPAEVVQDTLEGLKGELEEKGKNVAAYFQNLEADVDAMKAAEQRIATRRKSLENRVAQMKQYLKFNMEQAGITKIESPEFSVKVQNNPPAVDVFDEEQIPGHFMKKKIVESLDKTAIKKDIQAGNDVPGAKLSQSTRLVIK